METKVHPVDERLPLGKLLLLGLQHLLAMYAGAVTVPLVLAGALHLPKEVTASLINADLVAGGIVSIIQSLGFGMFGIRYPMMMGVTFVAIGPMIGIGLNPELGLPGIFGAVIAAGLVGIVVAPLMSRLVRLFPPIVTGSVILLIGVSLMGVAVMYSGGGYGVPNFGAPLNLAVAFVVVVTIIVINRFSHGFVANVAVLIGMGIGGLLSLALGMVSFKGIGALSWVSIVRPLQFGVPKFELSAIAAMTIVMLVTLIESMGGIFALGEIIDKSPTRKDLVRGLRTDGLGAVIGGLFNTFPYTSYSQNIGLISVSGIRSRYVCVAAGAMMILLGTVPKIAFGIASIPAPVIGGACLVMFGMVAGNGVRLLQTVDFRSNRSNLLILSVSLGMGMIPMVSDKFFAQLPAQLGTLLNSGIALTAISAVVLNLVTNGTSTEAQATEAVKDGAQTTH